jgi:hypothetical protein
MSSKIPFNIKLLQLDAKATVALKPITTNDTFEGATRNFHPSGLFSVNIFGRVGDPSRMKSFAYIDIKVPILHPLVVRVLGKLKRIYPEILMGKTYAVWDATLKDFVKSDMLSGETGYHFFMQHFEKIQFPQRLSDIRELNIKFIEKVRGVNATTERIIVAPAGFRDFIIHADDREEEDEVNALYRKMLSVSNPISRSAFEASPKTFDKARASLQSTFIEIFEYFEKMVEGKNKLFMGKWLTREIAYGTRNVITTQNLPVKKLFAPDSPGFNHTGIGLFQYLKAYQPVCIHQVRENFISKVFTTPQAPALLVNMKTLHTERVLVDSEHFDSWMTPEGLERIFNLYGEESVRHEPIVIEGRYLGLIYNDGKGFKLFQDIDELPEGADPKFVKPITLSELFYIAVYQYTENYILNVTRFPVTGFGSIYPSIPYLKPTMATVSLQPMNDQWEFDEQQPIAYNFPVRDSAFVNTLMPAPNKLGGLNADFDGDKCTGMGIFSLEACEEGRRVLKSRNFYVLSNGKIAHSLNTDTVKYLMRGLTSKPQAYPVTEAYREENDSTFEHYGEVFSINKVHEIIEKKKLEITYLNANKSLAWLLDVQDRKGLKYETLADPERIKNADTETPLIVIDDPRCDLVVADGLHRLVKAVRIEHRTMVPCYVLKYSDIASARV